MYNLGMHLKFDLSQYPWRWIQYWSRLLEEDLLKRRMEASKPKVRRPVTGMRK